MQLVLLEDPLWPLLAVSAVALTAGVGIHVAIRRLPRWPMGPRYPRCARCGYDVRAATAERCPECGLTLAGEGVRPPITDRRKTWLYAAMSRLGWGCLAMPVLLLVTTSAIAFHGAQAQFEVRWRVDWPGLEQPVVFWGGGRHGEEEGGLALARLLATPAQERELNRVFLDLSAHPAPPWENASLLRLWPTHPMGEAVKHRHLTLWFITHRGYELEAPPEVVAAAEEDARQIVSLAASLRQSRGAAAPGAVVQDRHRTRVGAPIRVWTAIDFVLVVLIALWAAEGATRLLRHRRRLNRLAE